jgi:ribosomal protein L16 Arg81 hydroxylase
MSAELFDLARLLFPVTPNTFFGDTWEKRPLVVARTDRSYYSSLLSMRDVDDIIYFTRPRFSQFRTFRQADEGSPPPENYVRGLSLGDEPPADMSGGILEPCQVYGQGKTIIVHSVQRRRPSIAGFCRNLEAAFHSPVYANMYLTPRSSQAFEAHFDTHEVFIVQIEGSKHWRLYGTARVLPLLNDVTPVPSEQLGPPTKEIVLNAGDVLYMPRGLVHEAFTSASHSLHLTVGILVYRWIDLVSNALACVSRQDVGFREALPVGVLGSEELPASMKDRFHELLHRLATSARVEDAVERLSGQFLEGLQALPDGHFARVDDLERVGPDTPLEKSTGVICRVVHEEDTVSIRFPGARIYGPKKIARALHFIATAGRFTAASLPDDLTAAAKLILVRRLIREGLLVAAVAGSTSSPTSLP